MSTYGGTDHVDVDEITPDNLFDLGNQTELRPGRTWLIAGPFRTTPGAVPAPPTRGRGQGKGRGGRPQ